MERVKSTSVLRAQGRIGRSGASRAKQKIPWEKYFGGLLSPAKSIFIVCVAVGLILLVVKFNPQEKLQEYTHRPIKEVQLEGSFRYLASAELQQLVVSYMKDSFLQVDLSELKQQIERNPWVENATIVRKWPDKLVVQVVEQQPIALWGEKSFLNQHGHIVKVENTSKIKALPVLQGEDRYAQEIKEQYLRIGKLLAPHDLVLNTVQLDKTRAWTIRLQSGVTIKLGRDRLWEKLQYLLVAKTGELGAKFNNIAQIDMRYPSGFAVTWKENVTDAAVAGGY
jgi:cell division protein FtsQ